MATEILSTRLLSPLFGGDIYLWTSSISVTLLALSVGYFKGGKHADTRVDKIETLLFTQVIFAAIALLITPRLTQQYLAYFPNIDMELSVFIAMCILIGPPLYFLGKCSPIIVKIALNDFNKLGSHVSIIYVISTIGSLAGSILAGFVLLRFFNVRELLFATSLILVCPAYIYFIKTRQFKYTIYLIFFILLYPTQIQSKDFSNSTLTFQYQKDTFYGSVKIIDIETKDTNRNARYMMLDGMIQGGIDSGSTISNALYSHYIDSLIRLHSPSATTQKSVLLVGLGPGVLPTALKDAYRTTSIEINPVIVETAKKYFGFTEPVHIVDARKFLNTNTTMYDNIVVDAYSGDNIPEHLATKEFMVLLKKRLTPSGNVYFNMVGNPYTGTGSNALLNTIHSIFSKVDIYPLDSKNNQMMNFIVHATNSNNTIDNSKLFNMIETKIRGHQDLNIQMRKANYQYVAHSKSSDDILLDNSNRIMFLAQQEKSNARQQLYPFILQTMF